jgi:hypothetical protein
MGDNVTICVNARKRGESRLMLGIGSQSGAASIAPNQMTRDFSAAALVTIAGTMFVILSAIALPHTSNCLVNSGPVFAPQCQAR